VGLGRRLARSSLKLLPKLLVVLVGIGLYYLVTNYLEGDLKSLLIGISSTLISIPFIFIFYEIWQEKAHRKLNSSAYEFAQNQMTVNIASIKEKLEIFIHGAFCYFDRPGYVVNDSIPANGQILLSARYGPIVMFKVWWLATPSPMYIEWLRIFDMGRWKRFFVHRASKKKERLR